MKPFDFPFTPFHNYILDHIMPDLSPNAWKVLCVAIRQTFGWVDETTESGRRFEDEISYSQFMDKSGIGGRSTLSKAIKECLTKFYLKRRVIGKHPGTGRPIYAYHLNKDYEIAASPEIGPAASPETGLTKETKKERKSGGGVQEHLYTLLIDFGVSESVAQKLAEEELPEEQVEGWITYTKQATNLHSPVAFLVSKLQSGERVPQRRRESAEDRYDKYCGGKYGHLVRH